MRSNTAKVNDQTIETITIVPHDQWIRPGAEAISITKEVPSDVAVIVRQMARRGWHGVYLEKIGGRDMLAELALHEIPFKLTSRSGMGTGLRDSWVVGKFDLAKSEPEGDADAA